MPCEESEDKKSRDLWTATSKPEGVKRMPICLVKEDGREWTAAAPAAPAVAAPSADASSAAAPDPNKE